MPTPYERYVKGWKRAEEEMARRKQLGFQERGVELGEQKFGLEEEKWDIMGPYHEAQTEKLGRPEEPEDPHKAWDLWTPQQRQGWLKRQAFGDQSALDPTTYDRDTALKERHRMEYMTLRDKFDERGMFTGTPQEFAKFKIREADYGEEEADKPTQLEKDKDYVRRRLTTMITSAITERAKQGETISKALAIKTPEVREVLAELKPVYPEATREILEEMGGGLDPILDPTKKVENDFINQAKGKAIDWDVVAEKWPNLDTDYIKSKL